MASHHWRIQTLPGVAERGLILSRPHPTPSRDFEAENAKFTKMNVHELVSWPPSFLPPSCILNSFLPVREPHIYGHGESGTPQPCTRTDPQTTQSHLWRAEAQKKR